MNKVWMIALLSGLALNAHAQAPVGNARARDDAIVREQYKAGTAYHQLQQAEGDAKLAEQAYREADGANKAAQKQAAESQRRLEAAKKKLKGAKTKEARARQSYEKAINAVSELSQQPAKK